MICDTKIIELIRVKKHNVTHSFESKVYYNQDYPLFGISKLEPNLFNGDGWEISRMQGQVRWGIIHRPSESIVISSFNKRKDAERFLDYLLKRFDLNSILLCDPDIRRVYDLLDIQMEDAYQEYFSEVKMRR